MGLVVAGSLCLLFAIALLVMIYIINDGHGPLGTSAVSFFLLALIFYGHAVIQSAG